MSTASMPIAPLPIPELESGLAEDLLFPAGDEEKAKDAEDERIRLLLIDFLVTFLF